MGIILTLLLRFLWQSYPSLWACALFWATVLYAYCVEYRGNSWTKTLILVGAVMNATVTLANGGRMPFLGNSAPVSIWVAGTGKHLLFLCDRFKGFSLGDFFIMGGFFLSLLFWLFRSKNPPNSAISTAKQDS